MFSRRHPYLFFMLVSLSICAVSVTLISLLFTFGSKGADYEVYNGVPGERVGVVELIGVISDAKKVIRDIKTFREDKAVKAIVLRIDSPGGGVGPSQEIYREIEKTKEMKKIIIASMGSVAASGGYYAASATDGIMANPGTITGSIGVIMGYTNFKEIFEKIGLLPVVIKSGEFKDMGSPVRDMTEKEKQILQGFVDKVHQQFVNDVAKGRNMDLVKMGELADGRIYSGEEALELGLIDRMGNLEDAIEWAGRLGGIEGDVSAVYIKENKLSLLRYLSDSSLDEMMNHFIGNSIYADYRYDPSR
ncbi:MAG: signal peptide peptidase SppA [Proteobacteria bacterium]|nr:signal peptide peptidase SppA [Pseudomonadota bacterium]